MAFLTNALPQDRYVSIKSVNIGDVAVAGRSFGGLVFTQGGGWSPSGDLKDDNGQSLTTWKEDYIVVVHSATQAGKYFSSTSPEYKFAVRYFDFQTPAGAVPRTLAFAKYSDAPADALERLHKGFGNFGSFCFIDPITADDVYDVATKNKGYGYKYLYSQAAFLEGADSESVDSEEEAVSGGTKTNETSMLALNAYIRSKTENGISGFCKIEGSDLLSAQMPMALFGATDYNAAGTAPNPMFKQYDGEGVTVYDDTLAGNLDEKNINYNGRVMANGATMSFYQRGRNDDGEDTAVYCNEVWLKSAVAAGILDLMISTNRVDAGSEGEALIYSIVDSVARQGLMNGAIEIGKALNDQQKRKITQSTGDPTAWIPVQESGYWIDVKIVQSDGTDGATQPNDYKAIYQLVYSKGDSIKFVEGTHYLV